MKKESLKDAHKFKVWNSNLLANGLTIHKIEEIYIKHRHNGEVLFALVDVDASLPEGGKIPPICFVKGSAVSVLICMEAEDTGEKFLLLVKQRRICDGSITYEHAAGMIDKDDLPIEVAIREVEEETGLNVSSEQVKPLHTRPYYPSTATCDEAMYLFYCELKMPKAKIFALHNQNQGVAAEHVQIETCIVTISEALALITNTCSLLNIYMYLEKTGKI